jgi:hypothetical protein
MALVIHSYYIAGVTNFGDFVANRRAPMYVESLHGLTFELDDFYRGLILQTAIGGM